MNYQFFDGGFMAFEHTVPLSTFISFIGLLFVGWQLRQNTKQRESESLVKLYDINRDLISLGFSHPALFKVLEDSDISDRLAEKRYLQLWLNQQSLMFEYLRRYVKNAELKASLNANLMDFMTMKNLQRHWREYSSFYPNSFQIYVNEILKKVEPPEAAQLSSGI